LLELRGQNPFNTTGDACYTDCPYSYTVGAPSSDVVPAAHTLPEPARPHQTKVEVDVKPIRVSPKPAAAPLGELDEGRHRTHALYAKGPDSDGLFRCPFKAAENCPHKATKLKCNYEYEQDLSYVLDLHLLTTLLFAASSLILT